MSLTWTIASQSLGHTTLIVSSLPLIFLMSLKFIQSHYSFENCTETIPCPWYSQWYNLTYLYEDDFFVATFAGEFYYQTRLSVVHMMYDIRFELEAAVGNGYMSVHVQSYCQQREVSVSHGKLEKLVPNLWQQLECRKTCGRQTTTGCWLAHVDGADIGELRPLWEESFQVVEQNRDNIL